MNAPEWSDFSAERRAAAYWFTDGLPEIVAGIAFVVLGCTWLFAWDRTLASTARLFLTALSILVMFALVACDRELIEFIKARVTYPRTGYVRAPDANTRQKAVIVLLFGRIVARAISKEWAVPVILLRCALMLFLLNRNRERSYRLWSVLLLAVLGLGSLLFEVPLDRQQWLVFVIGGAWLLAQGASNLVGYLRTNPRRVTPFEIRT